MRVGIFDSGLGGLTVLKKLLKKYPNCEYIYYGDSKNIPFGNKNIDELKNIATNIVDFLISKNVDIIVIACGTISSNLSCYLKNKYNIPIFDIISDTIEYINCSNYSNIGILCTEGTKNSKIFEKNINKKIEVLACSKLTELIENNDSNIDNYIKEKLKLLKNKDLIVLGCTHYPLVEKEIKKYTNSTLLNMADCIKLSNIYESKFIIEIYFSEINKLILDNVKLILNDYKYIIKHK